jgi:hypothetical protein
MNRDLDLVPTDELLSVLKSRFDVFAMVGLFDRGSTLKTEDLAYAFRGEPFACIGALEFLKAKVQHHLQQNIQEKPNE